MIKNITTQCQLASLEVFSNADIFKVSHVGLPTDFIVLSDSDKGTWRENVQSFHRLRNESNNLRGAVATYTPSFNDLKYAFTVGMSDYIVVSNYIDIDKELARVASIPRKVGEYFPEDRIREMALFRSLGLTRSQIDLLAVFASTFSRLTDLADLMGRNEDQLRKTFSRIYLKLKGPISVDCPARLAHVLTLCINTV